MLTIIGSSVFLWHIESERKREREREREREKVVLGVKFILQTQHKTLLEHLTSQGERLFFLFFVLQHPN